MTEALAAGAIAIAGRYALATGVPCRVLDRDGALVWPDGAGSGRTEAKGCGLCPHIRKLDPAYPMDCGDIHRYGVYQAERFGGKYMYFCPASLLHWAVPVTSLGESVAALIGGPVLLVEPEELISEELKPRGSLDAAALDSIRSYLRAIPLVEPARATAFAEVLQGLSGALGLRAVLGAAPGAFGGREPEVLAEEFSEGAAATAVPAGSAGDDMFHPFEFGGHDASYPLQKEKDLLACVAGGDQEGARRLMNDLLGHIFFSSGKRMDAVRARVQELAVLLSRAALEGGASQDEVFGLNSVYLTRLKDIDSFEDMAFLLAKITRRFADCVFDLRPAKHADVLHKAIRYFSEHIADDISLESAAAHVYLSPSYFGKLFKQEMKMSCSEYLSRLRVERARRLLPDRSLPIAKIAEMVGFGDQGYFTKVFRKITGMSPGEYRVSRGAGRLSAPGPQEDRNG